MDLALTNEQKSIHERALFLCREYRRLEWPIVEVLQRIDRSKLFKKLGYASLFQYAVTELRFSEAVAYYFISVARKAAEIPALKTALENQRLSVAKAGRIVAALSAGNARELVEFAATHSSRETAFEVARLCPKAARSDKVTPISAERVELKISMSTELLSHLTRTQCLIASQLGTGAGYEKVLEVVLSEYMERHDPVRKAKRIAMRSTQSKAPVSPAPVLGGARAGRIQMESANSERSEFVRKKLSAVQKHAVHLRDGGRCTHVDAGGNRCLSERWLHIHHLRPVSLGGGNDPENLTTLCSYHHDLAHQLSLPIEGQVTWLRQPMAYYGFSRRG
jgi:hypothetical protein